MASNNIARLGVVLGLDTAEFTASIDKAINENKKLGQAIKRDTNAAANEIIALKYATDDYGKTLTKVQMIEREISQGKFRMATDDVKQKLLAQAAAYDAITTSSKKAATGLSQFEKQNLMYQTTDFVTQVASGQNALIAFMQQGGQLKDVMGGVKETLVKLTPIVFSVTGAFVAGGAAIGALGYAMYSGRKEFDEFNKTIILTGNYSKVTMDDFGKMATVITTKSKASLGDAKDILNTMISSGQFTNKTFDAVSKTIQRFSELTGLSAKEAANKLIPSLDGTAASAKRLNDQYNFLTIEQYKHIELLDKEGKRQESIVYTTDLLNKSFGQTTEQLGYIEKALDTTKKKWSEWWNSAMNLGKPETLTDKLKKIEDAIKLQQDRKIGFNVNMPKELVEKGEADRASKIQALNEEKEAILEVMRLTQKKQDLTGQKEKIGNLANTGGSDAELARQKKVDDARSALKYARLLADADEENKIQIESDQRKSQLYSDYLYDIKTKDIQFAGQRKQQYLADLEKENVERAAKLEDFNLKQIGKEVDAAQAARFARQKIADEEYKQKLERLMNDVAYYDKAQEAAKVEKDKLEAQIKMVGLSEKQVKLAEIEAKYQEDIAKNVLIAAGDKGTLDAMNAMAAAKKKDAELNVELADQLQYLKDINDTVWKDMTSALEDFVNTGTLNFSKLTQSILQDLLKIQLKKQAMALWESASGGKGVGGLLSAAASFLGFADGGDPPVGVPSIVGERGPEIFVPKTAGTIIPNNMLGGMGGGQTINYNGPYIANMSAIDTQSGAQFLAKNKQAVWATYQSANRSIPMSR